MLRRSREAMRRARGRPAPPAVRLLRRAGAAAARPALGPPLRTLRRRVLGPAAASVRRNAGAWRVVLPAALAGLLVAALTIGLAGPWESGRRTAEQARAAELTAERRGGATTGGSGGSGDAKGESGAGQAAGSVPEPMAGPVLTPLPATRPAPGTGSGPAGGPSAALAGLLRPLLDDPALGSGPAVTVVDVATGRELFTTGARAAAPPASTMKLATGVAALAALGPEHRLTTRVVYDAGNNRVVLTGGGDTTLTSEDLAGLARTTAGALSGRGIDAVGVGYDAGRFSGSETHHPIGVNDNISPLTSLMVNGGRLDGSTHGPAPRAVDPAAEAAAEFVAALAEAGITVKGSSAAPRTAPGAAEELAVHHSAPLAALVERALTYSDNDLAESLGRQVAAADGRPLDLAGVSRALTDRLAGLGLPTEGLAIADASGLDREGRLTTGLLARLLALAAGPDHPELRPVLTGMPVAGFNGTLRNRYEERGGGLIRAKTGTLTGVNALAGTAVDADGRVLAFAFLAHGTVSPSAAEAALDTTAATLLSCGCP
ncbi:D-alanyl-D-alanine carboxypeptidase / D-alanyl-D-alanine-endopeptidase (penicillin-binding protein 4) [Streptomyces aidingensis]|uniref:D-alanyl-D-alanine carboxypeptidase / D-alanyl-D-alanine-endopeptidase (Penicillin-binding protein 4) n=2 Tax=Streptomyces aidingensis TaxID=910347 RepID=A0A1I1R8Z9_9ACTN|nr:D-alanyl-D-alanine carboxypeptidase / D-alanyl-D-alanine-endopeptidase (penicillin-binding protein 4) [Streptomyces aidingensis]